MEDSKKDRVFGQKLSSIKDFTFNDQVADVFDDMVERSIPFYQEIHNIILDLVERHYHGGHIYDLGCSTGTTITLIDQLCREKNLTTPSFIGVDNSSSMIKRCREKLNSHHVKDYSLKESNIEEIKFENPAMIIMNYTLQFLDPSSRSSLLNNIYNSLSPGGFFILSEKIHSSNESMDELLIELYYDFKRRNGYSELEISQKREALENVLKPLTPEKQLDQLKQAGFEKVDMIFRCYNFACYLGVK